MRRRGLSAVIATVLIILVTIVAVSIIAPFVFKFVRTNLDDSSTCFGVVNDISFANTEYNCNAASGPTERTGFSVKIDNEDITAFNIVLQRGGTGNTIEISAGSHDPRLMMLNTVTPGTFNEALLFPDVGGVRTYIADSRYDTVQIAPVVGGKICDVAETIKMVDCGSTENSEILA
jgi:flagellin-like protein